MPPAQQGLEAAHPVRAEVDDRLVMQLESSLRMLHGIAKIFFQEDAVCNTSIHACLVEAISIPTLGLSAIECRVGVLVEVRERSLR